AGRACRESSPTASTAAGYCSGTTACAASRCCSSPTRLAPRTSGWSCSSSSMDSTGSRRCRPPFSWHASSSASRTSPSSTAGSSPRTSWAPLRSPSRPARCDRSPDAVLGAPPASISLTFSETVIPAGKGIKVFSPSGRQVAGPARAEGHLLTAPISSTETGTFVVTWQALAADTHPSRGAFSFVVGQPSASPYLAAVSGGEIGTARPRGFALPALARWIHVLGFALTFGIIAYQVVSRREPRLRRFAVIGVVLLIAAEPVALVAQLASLSFDGDTAIAILAS